MDIQEQNSRCDLARFWLPEQVTHLGFLGPGFHSPNVAITTVKLAPFSPSASLSLIFTAPQMCIGPATHAFIIRPSMQHIKFCSLIPNCRFVLFIEHGLWRIIMRILGLANLIFFSLTLYLYEQFWIMAWFWFFVLFWSLEIKSSHHCALTFYKSFLQLAKRTRIQFAKEVLLYFSKLSVPFAIIPVPRGSTYLLLWTYLFSSFWNQ